MIVEYRERISSFWSGPRLIENFGWNIYVLSSVGALTTADDADTKSSVRSVASHVSIVQCNSNTKWKGILEARNKTISLNRYIFIKFQSSAYQTR